MAQKLQYRSASVAPPGPPWWRQRWGALTIGAIALALLLLTFAGKSWPSVLYVLLSDGALLMLWLTAAAGYGALLPLPCTQGRGLGRGASDDRSPASASLPTSASNPSPQPSPPSTWEREQGLRVITPIGLGLGVISILQLLLGLAGLLQTPVGYGVVVIGVALLAIRFRDLSSDKVSSWLTATVAWEYLWLLATPLLAAVIVSALVPPGILWGDEPHGYDVVEYHLQLPREWYELERITPLHHNVFSYFPLNVEMHFLLAMQLKAGPWRGMYLAQLMHTATIALTVFSIYAGARLFASKPRAIVAALAAAATPWMLLLAPIGYNEGGLLLFGTLAIGWLLHSLRSSSWHSSAIGGLAAGFACGVKLTAVPLLLILAPLLAIRRPMLFKRLAVFVIAGVVTFSPWLIKNAIWARNPFFPEAQSVFGRAHFTAEQSERWKRAHTARDDQRSLSARLAAVKSQIAIDQRYAYTLIPTAIIAAIISFRRREAQFLLAILIAYLIMWTAVTHLQGRFFVLAIPIAALLLATWRPALAVIALAVGMYFSMQLYFTRVADLAANQILAAEDLSALLPSDVQVTMSMDKNDPHFALVGDAKAFIYQVPMKNLRYRTVFDVQGKPGENIIQAWLGEQQGSPYIVVDPFELDRFSRTYYGLPRFGPEIEIPRDRVTVLKPQKR